ncbi:MAG: hypothetical protein SVG88_01135 [Halobacteriales archaeon]|nr:hypothetical protein [Halobacteriales archaeon]
MERQEADRVVVSYPEDLSGWGQQQIKTPWFKAYLGKTKHSAIEGEEWEEFVGVGCCGNSLDVPLRVESVENGNAFGPDTEIEYTTREACGVQGGWRVQSQDGPTL